MGEEMGALLGKAGVFAWVSGWVDGWFNGDSVGEGWESPKAAMPH